MKPGCPDSEIVRAAVERLREEVFERTVTSYANRAGYGEYVESGLHFKLCHEYGAGIEEALDCLVALAAGKPWPPESEKP